MMAHRYGYVLNVEKRQSTSMMTMNGRHEIASVSNVKMIKKLKSCWRWILYNEHQRRDLRLICISIDGQYDLLAQNMKK